MLSWEDEFLANLSYSLHLSSLLCTCIVYNGDEVGGEERSTIGDISLNMILYSQGCSVIVTL
jgi:hypothetical protein